MEYAQEKLQKKNLDIIVANDVSKPGAGFNTDTNLVKIITRDSDVKELPMMDKKRIAEVIVDMAKEKLQEKCRG